MEPEFRLEVDRTELREALRFLSRLVRRQDKAEVVLSYRDGRLVISSIGGEAGASAQGVWNGQVRVPSAFVLHGADILRGAHDPVRVTAEHGTIRVGDFGVECRCQSDVLAPIELPYGAPLTAILGLPLKYTPGDIERSGLTKTVSEGLIRKEKIVTQAVEVLKPLGVSYLDVIGIVDSSIRRANRLA